MAPIDIIISIIKRAENENRSERSKITSDDTPYLSGKIDQCKELIDQLEVLKKLFS